MLRKITPWLLFLLCLALLGMGATPFGPLADHIAVASRFALVIFLSILLLRDRFGGSNRKSTYFESFKRWCHGERR